MQDQMIDKPDPRHVEILVRDLGVGEENPRKPVSTPGVKLKEQLDDDEPFEDPRSFRSWCMRAAYLSADRPDIAFAVKSVA